LEIRPELQWVAYGVLMIVIVTILPSGIVPALARWWNDRGRAGTKPAQPADAGAGQAAR
jgi:branched-chain amino acid transport system permease protein